MIAAGDPDDSTVIAKAQQLEAILLSLNGDFGDIVMYPPSSRAPSYPIVPEYCVHSLETGFS